MATSTRVVRRLRPPDRPASDIPESARHSDGMMAYILKAEAPDSKQIVDPFVGMYGDGLAIEPPLPPERLLLLSDENAAHGACLDAKADDAVGRGWLLEDSTTGAPATPAAPAPAQTQEPQPPDEADVEGAGGETEQKTAELAELLENITPDYTFDELLWQAAWERDAIGWAGWEIVRGGPSGSGEIAAIYPIPAHTLRMTRDKDIYVQERGGQFVYFARFGADIKVDAKTGAVEGRTTPGTRQTAGQVGIENIANECLLFRGYSARNQYYPVPRWVSAIPAIAELTAIREYNVAFYVSGGVVDRVIHAVSGDATEAAAIAKTISDALDEAESGAHLSIVTGGTTGSEVLVKFLTPTQGRREGQFTVRRAELTDEVLMAHKVPGYRISKAIVGSLGGAPTREMLHAYRTGVVESSQTIMESRLNQTLFGPRGINLAGRRWALEDLDWDETELDLKIAQTLVEQGMAEPDEGREIVGLSKTGRPEMTTVYYKGVALGSRQAGPPGAPGAGAPPSQAALDALAGLRDQAAARLRPVVPEVPPATNGSKPPAEPAPVV